MHISKNKTISYLVHALISLFICILCCGTLLTYPPHKSVSVKTLNNISEINELAPGNYVNLTIDQLYYTGLDSKNNEETNGHYYYNITDNNCTLFLLSDESIKKLAKDSVPDTITDYTIQGKIIDDENFNTKIRASFAKQINWSNYELSKMTYPYLVSEINPEKEIDFHLTIILIMMTVIFLIMSALNFILYFKRRNYIRHETHF